MDLRSEGKFAQEIHSREIQHSLIGSNRSMFEGQGLGEDGVAEAMDMHEIAVTVLRRAGPLRREPLERQLLRGRPEEQCQQGSLTRAAEEAGEAPGG